MTIPNIMDVARAQRAQVVHPLLLKHIVPGEQVDEVLGEKGPWLRLDTGAMIPLLGKIFAGQELSMDQLNTLNHLLKSYGVRASDGTWHYVRALQQGSTQTPPAPLSEEPAPERPKPERPRPMDGDELRSRVQGLVERVEALEGENEALRQENQKLNQQLADRLKSGVPDDVAAMLRSMEVL